MNCIFYKCTDYKNTLTKTLTSGLSLDVKLLTTTAVTDLTVRLKRLPLSQYNYCYIEKLNRYYFINDVIVYSDYITVQLSVDVLMTYRDEILNSQGIVNRSVASGDDYTASNDYTSLIYPFDTPFTDESDVLVTVQGA